MTFDELFAQVTTAAAADGGGPPEMVATSSAEMLDDGVALVTVKLANKGTGKALNVQLNRATVATGFASTPSHRRCRTSERLCASSSAPVSSTTSGCARRSAARMSSIGETMSVARPPASSRALMRTAGSTSVSEMSAR